jgi:hypothetical protein
VEGISVTSTLTGRSIPTAKSRPITSVLQIERPIPESRVTGLSDLTLNFFMHAGHVRYTCMHSGSRPF